jgi:CRP-like cAMP-binding protein
MAAFAVARTYEPDEMILREGKAADAFFLILGGLVAIELLLPDRGVLRLQTVGAGEVIGWSWLVPPYRWEFDARAVSRTSAVLLDGRKLRDLFESDHSLGFHFVRDLLTVVAERLKAARLQLLDIYGAPREVRR